MSTVLSSEQPTPTCPTWSTQSGCGWLHHHPLTASPAVSVDLHCHWPFGQMLYKLNSVKLIFNFPSLPSSDPSLHGSLCCAPLTSLVLDHCTLAKATVGASGAWILAIPLTVPYLFFKETVMADHLFPQPIWSVEWNSRKSLAMQKKSSFSEPNTICQQDFSPLLPSY